MHNPTVADLVLAHRRRALLMILLALAIGLGDACGPGRGGGRRPMFRKLTPLVFKQHVPNVSENTATASGLVEGRVSRIDKKFRDLVPNYNQDIIFKDEEGTGADRLMSKRCKDKLNTLAISVMNQWPGVKLRVVEGWDEEGKHAQDSLHYEGRAVDVTTSDRDRAKYGMLARLAVEAGFDWVYYESRSHIHCSVKSESMTAHKNGGCFPGMSLVRTSDRKIKRLDQLKLGDHVAALDQSSGKLIYSEVIAFLDRITSEKRQFIKLTTKSGYVIKLTPTHLVPVKGKSIEFASRVRLGDKVLVGQQLHTDNDGLKNILEQEQQTMELNLRWEEVIEVMLVLEVGAYAPLTYKGTILVDDVVASCYAVLNNHRLAHYAFLPLRLLAVLKSSFREFSNFLKLLGSTSSRDKATMMMQSTITAISDTRDLGEGIHWYASVLWHISFILPRSMFHD